MRPYAIRLLTLVVYATASIVPAVTESEASSLHVRKHHKRMSHGWDNSWGSGAVRPVARPPGGDVCPGSGRSFDCKVWPPPFDEDPDRKISGSDGGG
jgi:hypothetical protein